MTNETKEKTMTSDESGTALIRHSATAIEPRDMGELQTLAAAAAKSNFFGVKTQEQALVLLMAGRDLGLSYTQALRAFHVIEGRPSLSADGMVAVCLARRDVCLCFRVLESDDVHATVETQRAGDPPQKLTFTVADARRAGIVKERGNWEKWPGRMCLARAKSFLARQVYPDLLMGLYDPDELREVAPYEAPAVRQTVEEIQPSEAALSLAEALRAVTSAEELDAVSADIAAANLTNADKALLRAEYRKAKDGLEVAA